MPPERREGGGRGGGEGEVGGWKMGGEGGRKTRRRGERTEAFVPCFVLFPEDRLTRAVFHRSGSGEGGEGKRITSTEGEWHKVENLPVVYRLVYNTGLSERPRSPLLFAASASKT